MEAETKRTTFLAEIVTDITSRNLERNDDALHRQLITRRPFTYQLKLSINPRPSVQLHPNPHFRYNHANSFMTRE